jgi:hypothetical protein
MSGITTKIEKRHQYWYWTVVFTPTLNNKVTCEGACTTRKAARACAATAKEAFIEGIRKAIRG